MDAPTCRISSSEGPLALWEAGMGSRPQLHSLEQSPKLQRCVRTTPRAEKAQVPALRICILTSAQELRMLPVQGLQGR